MGTQSRATLIGRAAPAAAAALAVTAAALLAVPRGAEAQFPFRFGAEYADVATDVAIGEGGNVYVVGWFQGVVDFDPSPRLEERISISDPSSPLEVDAFVAKYTSSGTLIWVRTISGKGMQVLNAVAFRDGTVFLGGSASGITSFEGRAAVKFDAGFGRDAMVAACNVDGEFLWSLRMGDAENGGSGWDDLRVEEVLDLATDAEGNLFATGVFTGTIDLNPLTGPTFWDTYLSAADNEGNRSRDLFVASYDHNGDFRWGFAVGDAGRDEGRAIGVAPDGSVYVAGFLSSAADFTPGDWTSYGGYVGAGTDGFLAKYDSNRGLYWVVGFGGLGDDRVAPGALAVVGPAGGESVLLGGEFAATADFAPGPSVAALASAGGQDGFVARYTRNGALQWVRAAAGAAGDDAINAVTASADGAILAGGRFVGAVSLAGAHGDLALHAGGTADAFAVELDASGEAVWGGAIGSVGGDEGPERVNGVAWSSSGAALVVGAFVGAADLDLGAGTVSATAKGAHDGFVATRAAGPPPRVLTALAITGATELFEGLETPLGCTASFSDGGSEDATTAATWAIVGSAPPGTAVGSGVLHAGLVGRDTELTVSATLARDGVSLSAVHAVTVRNVGALRQRPRAAP